MRQKSQLFLIVIGFLLLFLSGCFEKEEIFKISFQTNGGSNVAEITFENIQDFNFPDIPTKDGYTFEGWYWDNNTFLNPLSIESLLNYLDKDNLVVYAKWIEELDPLSIQLQAIYQLALEASSFSGTYEEWLESIRGEQGDPGINGKSVVLRLEQGMIQWQLEGDTSWIDLLNIEELKGEDGLNIISAQINENNELIFTYSDDSSINLGVINNAHTVIFKDMFGYVIDIYIINDHESVVAPDVPEREGYTFTHWDGIYTDITENQTITAIYVPNQYTVTLEFNDGTNSQTIENVLHGTSIDLPEPQRIGFIFKGWYLGESINDAQFTNQTPVEKNITLYARYDAMSFNVRFMNSNGELIKDFIIPAGETVIPPLAPTITGYTFIGWSEDFQVILKNLDIYPIYEINQYIISFDSLGGTSIDSIVLDYGTLVNEPEIPIKEGYQFMGWYLDTTYEYPYSFTIIGDENIHLYARWEPIINEFNMKVIDEFELTLTVSIGIYGNVNMNGYDIIIHYDESIISYVSHTNVLSNVVNATTPGMIRLNYSNVSAYLQDGQIIMSIIFEWIVPSYTDLWIEVIEAVLVDEEYNVFVVETNARGLEVSYHNEG